MDTQTVDQAQVQHIVAAMVPFFVLFGFVVLAVVIVPFWFSFKKAGLSPWLSLLVLIPLGPVICLYILAFARWRVVPAPVDYAAYPQAPLPGYPAPYPPVTVHAAPPATGYAAPGAYTPTPQGQYPPPPQDPTRQA